MFDPANINAAAFSYYACLQRVKLYVEEHYKESITLPGASRVAGLEAKYFSTFFHSKTGVCFKDWLTHIRITRAVELMKNGDHTITSIGFEVGFQDLRTFERAFKRFTGKTPQALKSIVRPS